MPLHIERRYSLMSAGNASGVELELGPTIANAMRRNPNVPLWFNRAIDGSDKRSLADRLEQIGQGTSADTFFSGCGLVESSNNDRWNINFAALQIRKEFEPSRVWHLKIGDNAIRRILIESGKKFPDRCVSPRLI
jgi:hypothetical protein